MYRTTIFRLPLIICFCFLFFYAKAQELTLDRENSKIQFFIKNAGMEVEGSLDFGECEAWFGEQNTSKKYFSVIIPLKTINTGNKFRDRHLLSEDYFDENKYPYISFESLEIQKNKQKWKMLGKLTIKNVSREVEIIFDSKSLDAQLTFKGDLALDRLDYGVGASSWILSDHVKIKIFAVFKKIY